jgi:wobble nucleotide-excising tRNase
MSDLEAHFSSEYSHFLECLDRQICNIKNESKIIAELDLPKSAELYEDLSVEYDLELTLLKKALVLVNSFLSSLENILTDKKGRVFESLDFEIAIPEIEYSCIDRLNDVILRHNATCKDFQKIISDARKRLEEEIVDGCTTEFKRLINEVQEYDSIEVKTKTDIVLLDDEITQLESEIIEYRKSAEELNEDLNKYLGHDELRLAVKETGYTITRNGTPTQSLSEGEMTAISLLYFLKSLEDRRFDLSNGVVVLDDPVSSLDANALYLAFGFIRERTNDAAQLFILTHNFSFFKEVRDWFNYTKKHRFYMLGSCT